MALSLFPRAQKAVGVSNYGPEAVKEVHAALKARGVRLGSNQIQFSLASRWGFDSCRTHQSKQAGGDITLAGSARPCLLFFFVIVFVFVFFSPVLFGFVTKFFVEFGAMNL